MFQSLCGLHYFVYSASPTKLWYKGVGILHKVLTCNNDTNSLELESTCMYFLQLHIKISMFGSAWSSMWIPGQRKTYLTNKLLAITHLWCTVGTVPLYYLAEFNFRPTTMHLLIQHCPCASISILSAQDYMKVSLFEAFVNGTLKKWSSTVPLCKPNESRMFWWYYISICEYYTSRITSVFMLLSLIS